MNNFDFDDLMPDTDVLLLDVAISKGVDLDTVLIDANQLISDEVADSIYDAAYQLHSECFQWL
ncbi:hypothetical protein F3F96_05270 [Mariprofundus sp. NF]|uniref:hypothetical protein n=1 Tax=Mariprofundus sp. NF TaxID=2608716 RepID=UPI0015A12396|nr:hypothetical protein [Mariprofundus sp. NF]NWF38537.1 hypothetical protein [Mariprofundus sp. NF]